MTDELRVLPAVSDVQVVLATGEAEITSEAPLDLDDARAVVEAAGYELSA